MKSNFSAQVYVEGGGDAKRGDLATECRKGFSALLERATGRKIGITACGSRNQAYSDFARAVKQRKHDLAVLLVDSEEVVTATDAWSHLKQRDKWEPLAEPAHPAHLMVVCMEAWLVADREALRDHFGDKFADDKIPQWPQLEQVGKEALYSALRSATKGTRKGAYDKGRDSFKILARVRPTTLEACPHARALFDDLKLRLKPR